VKRQHRRVGGLLVAAGVISVSACTSNDDRGDYVTLRVMNWATNLELTTEQAIADKFAAEHPGVRVIVESIVSNYGEKLISAIASGTPPHVFLLDVPDIPAFVERNLVLDLSPYIGRVGFEAAEVFPEVLDVFQRGDRLFAFPKGFTPMVVYYNKNIFSRLGVPEPPDSSWTWSEFLATARALAQDEDGDGRKDVFAMNFPRLLWEWMPWVWSGGGDIMDPSGTQTSGYLDGEATVRALEFLTSLVTEFEVIPPVGYRDEGDPLRVGRFFVGRQAMLASGHWNMPRLKEYQAQGVLDIGIAPIPHREGAAPRTVIYSAGWAVPLNVRNKRLAVELAAFLAGEEAQLMRAESGLEIPVIRRVAEALALADTTGVEAGFLAQVKNARTPWGARVMDFHEVERLAVDVMDMRLLQGTPIAEAAAITARRIDEVIIR